LRKRRKIAHRGAETLISLAGDELASLADIRSTFWAGAGMKSIVALERLEGNPDWERKSYKVDYVMFRPTECPTQ
jgi:hypothetical protein